jgi:hypothetical protein
VIISEFLKYYQTLILGLKEGGKEKKENDTLFNSLAFLSFTSIERGAKFAPLVFFSFNHPAFREIA